mmetsp:Transcript_27609/g.57976  ORF Transcript_27609/g.57976 Transcript_27609/m.57976 type:complete len:187 (+) Transcript_27609:110-670(+)
MKKISTIALTLLLKTTARSTSAFISTQTFNPLCSRCEGLSIFIKHEGVMPRHHNRAVHLPSLGGTADENSGKSVTGPIYGDETDGIPQIKLFTKEGCTLCDKVKNVLESLRESHPHSLYAMDITDDDKQEWFSKYKYDIPVLHINDIYWTKHRLSEDDAIAAIEEASAGDFAMRSGEPDAGRLERT